MSRAVYRLPTVKTHKGAVAKFLSHLTQLKIEVIHAFMGLFTRYDFVACDKPTTGLRHELFRVNQTYNSLTTLKSCRRPVVSLSHATKSCRVNRPYEFTIFFPFSVLYTAI